MIAVDTSALLAIILSESEAPACVRALAGEEERLVSAGTFAELLIVSAGRNIREEAETFIAEGGFSISPVTVAGCHRIADAYQTWGKGFHRAKLNLGDCFAYALAKERDCPLLYVGNDFAKTDVKSAAQFEQ